MDSKNEQRVKKGKEFVGKVVSLHMTKTVVVEVVHMKRHPLYKKALKRTRRFAVHNELEGIVIGDTVSIREVRPISKTKHFTLVGKINA